MIRCDFSVHPGGWQYSFCSPVIPKNKYLADENKRSESAYPNLFTPAGNEVAKLVEVFALVTTAAYSVTRWSAPSTSARIFNSDERHQHQKCGKGVIKLFDKARAAGLIIMGNGSEHHVNRRSEEDDRKYDKGSKVVFSLYLGDSGAQIFDLCLA